MVQPTAYRLGGKNASVSEAFTDHRTISPLALAIGRRFLLCLCLPSATIADEKDESETKELVAEDLELYQGTWELLHGDRGNGPTIRSIKTIDGNKSAIQRYDIATGERIREHTSTFELVIEGRVRFHRYRIHGENGRGFSSSFIYKVDEDHFYEVNGFLLANEHENSQLKPNLVRWTRIAESAAPTTPRASSDDQ